MNAGLSPDLGRFGARHNLGRQLAATQVVLAAQQIAVGRFVARSFRSGTLTISVSSQVRRRLVAAEGPAIIAATNAVLSRPAVQRLAFRVVHDSGR